MGHGRVAERRDARARLRALPLDAYGGHADVGDVVTALMLAFLPALS
jgi:hypothetical protein